MTEAIVAALSETQIEELRDMGAEVECSRCWGTREIHEDGSVEHHFAPVEPDEAIFTVRALWKDAEEKAWANLGRYKFSNFGYWSARVVFLGQLLRDLGAEQPANPFKALVMAARGRNGGAQ